MFDEQYYAKLGPEARLIDDLLQRAIGDVARQIIVMENIQFTPATTDAFIHACVCNGAGVAIQRNLDEGAFMRICRQAFARAMAATRRVDAEDDN